MRTAIRNKTPRGQNNFSRCNPRHTALGEFDYKDIQADPEIIQQKISGRILPSFKTYNHKQKE
jgi:hypothetical protein